MWLVRRVTVVGLLLVVLSASVVAVSRQNRSPTPLKALGFDVCDDGLCWRGLKPGMPRETALSIFPDLDNRYPMAVDDAGIIAVQTTSIVETIGIEANDRLQGLPITVGDIVAYSGPPCRALVDLGKITLFYPTMIVLFGFESASLDLRLQTNSSPDIITLTKMAPDGGCDLISRVDIGVWQGFTSIEHYWALFERAVKPAARP
jgi:hypothetical protein